MRLDMVRWGRQRGPLCDKGFCFTSESKEGEDPLKQQGPSDNGAFVCGLPELYLKFKQSIQFPVIDGIFFSILKIW